MADAPLHTRSSGARLLIVALFVVNLVVLTWVVVWKARDFYVPEFGPEAVRGYNLIPFSSYQVFGAKWLLEVLANVALFIPFGAFLRIAAPGWKFGWAVVAVAGVSAGFELFQFALGVGVADITDLMMNVLGGVIGALLWDAAVHAFPSFRRVRIHLGFAIGFVVLLLVFAAGYRSPVPYL